MMRRRDFLKNSLVAGVGASLSLMEFPAWATSGRKTKIISVFLRGGADVLSLFPPLVAKGAKNHPLALLRGRNPDETNLFLFDKGSHRSLQVENHPVAFHPAFAPLLPALTSQQFLVIPHTGSLNPTRSHFEQILLMEAGSVRQKSNLGFLGRAAKSVNRGGIALADKTPLILRGVPVALLSSLSDLRGGYAISRGPTSIVDGTALTAQERLELFKTTKPGTCEASAICVDASAAQAQFDQLARDLEHLGTDRESDFVHRCRLAAELTKGATNPAVISLEMGGWDSHNQQAPVQPHSPFYRNVADLVAGLQVLWDGMDRNNTVVVVMSEFGRTLRANESRGTDHGRGSAMLVFGASINRNRFIKNAEGRREGHPYRAGWDLANPEMDPHGGGEGSAALRVLVDYREIFAEILSGHLGVDLSAGVDGRTVFEGLTNPISRGLVG